MFKSRKSLMLGMMTLLAPMASAANAQDNGLGYAFLFGYGANNTPAIRSFVPAPPYFALHPPVYYGKRYTRPYGESPFAAWPQLRSPANYQPTPAANYAPPVVINFSPAHPQSGSAPMLNYPVVPAPGIPAPAGHVPAPANHPAPPAPAAPERPSPVVIRNAPVQPMVINNPYFRPNDSRLVGKPAIGQ